MQRGRFFLFLGILLILVFLLSSQSVSYYTESLVVNSNPQKDPLYQEILYKAKQYNQPSIEPRIDRVWRLIPGLNGVKVDVEKTYQKAKKNKDKYSLVFTETEPMKQIWDLSPQPIYRGNPQKKMAALMINVAWGNEYLTKILETLEKYQVKATFFLDGSWLTKNPDLAMQIVKAGHEIGSHAYSHPNMSRLSRERIIDEMERTNQKIEEILHIKTNLFAPPSGDFDNRVVKLAWERKMMTILWTTDTVDWRNPAVSLMVNKILREVDNGHLILMHPTEATARGMESMIIGIQKKGLLLGTVSQVLSTSRFSVENIGDF